MLIHLLNPNSLEIPTPKKTEPIKTNPKKTLLQQAELCDPELSSNEDATYTVYVNNLNFVQSPFIKDATVPIEVSKEEYLKVQEFKTEQAWKWNTELKTFESVTIPDNDALRFARELECFRIVNRSPLWFNTLSAEQQAELQVWYQAWLDITETQQVPVKPDWLK